MTTVHSKLLKVESGSQCGLIQTANHWVASDGTIICTDTRRLSFRAVPGGREIDWEITLRATHGEVKFADDKHGLMAIRTHPDLRLDNDPDHGVTKANGQTVNSEGTCSTKVIPNRRRLPNAIGGTPILRAENLKRA